MARPPSKRLEFERRIAAGEPPEQAASIFSRPAQALKRIEARAVALREPALEQAPEDDTALAKQTLRTVARLADGSPAVTAAKALLEHAPTTAGYDAEGRATVIFHGRAEDGKHATAIQGGPHPDRVVSAVRLLDLENRLGREAAIAKYRERHQELAYEQVREAVAVWRIPACQEAALRVLAAHPEWMPVDPDEERPTIQ